MLKNLRLQYLFMSIVMIYLIYSCVSFFTLELGQVNKQDDQFLAMHTMQIIKRNNLGDKSTPLCIYADDKVYKEFDTMHIKEMFEYYLYPQKVLTIKDDSLSDQTVNISQSCDKKSNIVKRYVIPCSKDVAFICPNSRNKQDKKAPLYDLEIHVDESL